MKLLFLLDGRYDKIAQSHNLNDSEYDVVKIDDKKLASPKFILSKIKHRKYDNIQFGCILLDFQRFHSFMIFYFFLSGFWNGSIIDESGAKIRFSFFKFLFIYIPAMFIEAILSFFIVIYYYVKLPLLKFLWIKK